MIKKKFAILMIIFLMGLSSSVLATDWPGSGIICCGDLWESYMPSGIGKNTESKESNTDVLKNKLLVRIGNMDRAWTSPTMHYPAGDIFTLTWSSGIFMTEYSPTEEIGAYRESIASDVDNYKNYCDAFWMPDMGNTDKAVTSTGDVHGGAPWTDDTRTQQLYEFFQPTNIGVDVKGRIRGYSFNEANMNDFIAIELELTNTGVQDNDCDGTIDREDHKIEALSLLIDDGTYGSMNLNNRGTRWTGWWPASRLSGYDGSPDPDGNPWDVPVIFATNVGEADIDATTRWAEDGKRKVAWRTNRAYFQDIWNGQQWIAVKEGGLDDGSAAPDKKTIYGSHPIGEGAERGWYVSRNRTKVGEPYGNFLHATGVFYEEGGKSEDPTILLGKVLKPDPNYFDTSQPYTVGDPVSFANLPVLGEQPMGDLKYTGFFYQNWERNYPGTPNPKIPAEDEWTAGCTPKTIYNFGSGASAGVGPFSLEVGETITVVGVEYGGYRLKGVRNALAAARFAYENDWNVPLPPPMPDMMVTGKAVGDLVKPRIIWDDAAESAADFAGYKIYRVTAFPQYPTELLGTRMLDTYHHQGAADIGLTYEELSAKYAQPKNPNDSPGTEYLDWNPGLHGPWTIVQYIPKSELGSYANPEGDAGTYAYEWLDMSDETQFGYTYWYYVAAFDNESGTIANTTFTSLESGKENVNGRTGTWMGTYPWTYAASDFPGDDDPEGIKAIGAPFALLPAAPEASKLVSGEVEILVRPNPYKVQAPHDVGNEHKIMFYNLPADTKIHIFDLSGQVMDVLEYYGLNPLNGTIFWDMFTKDGPEVQSGLYIWVAKYPGGQQTGYLAIMR